MLGTFCGIVSLFLLTTVAALVCENTENCTDCINTADHFTWCKRNNECHSPAALESNPCKTTEDIVNKSHCVDILSRYSPELSLKMLRLSAAAYDSVHPQECLNNSLPSDEIQLQTVVTKNCDLFDNNCSGYVAVSHTLKAIVVAFRGTTDFGQAFVQFVEALLVPKVTFLDGKVQTYWKGGFDELWPSMEVEVKALVSKNPSYQIWVTGHSLGGAMASLASTWLAYYKIAPRKNIILYTFGMPRVGNYDYALQHDQLVNNSWRVVNDDDLVPHFPRVTPMNIENGPYHHGIEAFYNQGATSVDSPHKERHGKPYNEDVTCSFSEIPRSIEKHKIYFNIPVGTFWKRKCVHKPGTPAKQSTASTLIISFSIYAMYILLLTAGKPHS